MAEEDAARKAKRLPKKVRARKATKKNHIVGDGDLLADEGLEDKADEDGAGGGGLAALDLSNGFAARAR